MNKNIAAETILSSLSPEAQEALHLHFRHQLVEELKETLTSSLSLSPSTPKRSTASSDKRVINRQVTNDGTNRSASQFIRDLDAEHPGASAKDVVEKAREVGLEIEASLVYNVRQNEKKKAAESESSAPAPASDDVNEKRRAGLEKARAAKKQQK